MILLRQSFKVNLVSKPVHSLVPVRLRGIIVHRTRPASACLIVLSNTFDLFLQSRRKRREFPFRNVILGILFPYRAADISCGDPSIIMNDRAPWAEFGDNDEVRDTRQCGGFVLGSEGNIAISSLVVESSRRTGDEIEYEVETGICAMENRVQLELSIEKVEIGLR